MSERPAEYETRGAYIEKLATFVWQDGRWDVCLYNQSFNDGQKYFRVRIPVPPELITGVIDAEVTRVEK